jgi:RNA polymerase sigma-70 factor (ECF subfamily)
LEPDAQLMLQVRAGDAQSFELLLARHGRPVVRYLTRMTGNQGVAEELAQEVFLRVYRARDGYEPTAKFTTWLYRIATRLALNSIRDRKPELNALSTETADTRATREAELVERAATAAIREAVARLPEKQRAAVLLHKYEELDYQQIAGVLDCSVSAVKSLLFRAYERLRTELVPLGRGTKKGSGRTR